MRSMRRTIGTFAAVVVGLSSLLAAAPAGAQEGEMVWSHARPDGHPPVGVIEGHIQRDGRYMLFYRYDYSFFDGIQTGTDTVSIFTAIDIFGFPEVATTLKTKTHTVGFQLGVTENFTVRASIPFATKEMENLLNLQGDPTTFVANIFTFETEGFGDIRVTALYEFAHEGAYRAHVHAGVSVPTGEVDLEDDGGVFVEDVALPYQMQTGTGTWDLLPGLTFSAQNDDASVGLQALGRIHIDDNERGYTFGDRVEANVWGAYRVNDYLSISARIHGQNWGAVEGADPALDPTLNFTENPTLLGGTRVDFPLGVNLYFPVGALQGHRLGLELSLPIHQDLDGPQLRQDWALSIGWQNVY